MSESKKLTVEAAWNSLWNSRSPYNLPATFKNRRHVGQVWFAHIPEIPLADTGPVVLMNREPWGVVTVNLKNAAVSNLHTIEPIGFSHNTATGEVTAQVQFRNLKYAGDYEVRRGAPTASALKLASAQLRRPDALDDVTDPNDSISLAKSYQDQLSLQGGPNGSIMLDTYYRHNDAYAANFNNPKFAYKWANYAPTGQNTAYYAAQTQTAATPGNTGTVSVNGQPDKQGSSPYNIHSFSMQLLVVGACNAASNFDAATAASCFDSATTSPSTTSQTVNSVMNIVQTTPPPNQGCSQQQQLGMAMVIEPEWKAKIRREITPHIEEIEKAEDDMRRGIILREETNAPIHGQFNSFFPTSMLTFKGKVETASNGSPQVKFASASGPFGDVPVRLGVFPGKLHPELTQSIDKAQFLKSILGKRVVNAIVSSKLADHLGHVLTAALLEI